MNKKRLVQIIKDPALATEMEIKEIQVLSSDYSYSSFLKVLSARIDNLKDNTNKSASLSKAAIYIADRTVLKEFMLHDKAVDLKKKVEAPAGTDDAVSPQRDTKMEVIPVENGKMVNGHKDKEAGSVKKVKGLKDKEASVVNKEEKQTIKEKIKDIIEKTEDIKDKEKEEKLEEIPLKKEKTKTEDIQVENTDEQSLKQKVKEGVGKTTEHKTDETKESSSVEDKPPRIKEEAQEENLISQKEPEEINEDIEEVIKEDAAIEELAEETEKMKDEKDEGTSLSSEIMKNISELRRHKASLFNFLNIDDKVNQKTEEGKSNKSPKKSKQKKDVKKNKGKDKSQVDKEIPDNTDILSDSPQNGRGSNVYPGYEEEDPKVIKDFLNELEKENPPPKRKLKKEEQEELIEKFIQSEPQLQNVQSSKELPEKKDLSLPSIKFRDDIISENLAGIMIKQGKLEKAIDIYKKLIWKFPQKKAYFATQIEELKKKSNK